MPLRREPTSSPKTERIHGRIDPRVRALLDRAAGVIADGNMNVFAAKAILEAAQAYLPGSPEQALPVPTTKRSPNGATNTSAVMRALAKRITALTADGRTFQIEPEVYIDLRRTLQAIQNGHEVNAGTRYPWLSAPEAEPPGSSRSKISIAADLRTATRFELAKAKRDMSTRDALETFVTEKCVRHKLGELGATSVEFSHYPPIPIIALSKHFDDTAMPIVIALTLLQDNKTAHLRAAVDELLYVLRANPPVLRPHR